MSADPLTHYRYAGGLVKAPGRYRSWSYDHGRGAWLCVYTSDSLRDCRRAGEVTLPYPDVPDDHGRRSA